MVNNFFLNFTTEIMRFVTPTIAKSPLHSTTRLTAIFDMIYYKFNDVRSLWGGWGEVVEIKVTIKKYCPLSLHKVCHLHGNTPYIIFWMYPSIYWCQGSLDAL
jgi:hypothetical protein